MKKFISILIVAVALLSSCYRDVEEQLYPANGGSSCDTTAVAYATTVVSILQSNGCISCHSGSAASGGISLQTYANVRAVAMNGKLYGAINHSAGFSPMPKGGNKMSACNILKIKAWIDKGTLNN
jgi:cytochrome c551/c552